MTRFNYYLQRYNNQTEIHNSYFFYYLRIKLHVRQLDNCIVDVYNPQNLLDFIIEKIHVQMI